MLVKIALNIYNFHSKDKSWITEEYTTTIRKKEIALIQILTQLCSFLPLWLDDLSKYSSFSGSSHRNRFEICHITRGKFARGCKCYVASVVTSIQLLPLMRFPNRSKKNCRVSPDKQDFERHLNPESTTTFPITLVELTTRLKKWKNVLQSNFEGRFQAVLRLEDKSKVLRDVNVVDAEIPGQCFADQVELSLELKSIFCLHLI